MLDCSRLTEASGEFGLVVCRQLARLGRLAGHLGHLARLSKAGCRTERARVCSVSAWLAGCRAATGFRSRGPAALRMLGGIADVTQLLDAAGDPKAAAELLPLVYDELRKLAAARMSGMRQEYE